MKIWAYFGLVGFLCCSGTFQASAQVVWASKELELNMTPGSEELKGDFTFTNSGESDVTITSVKPGCGCTTAAMEKKVYGPGEQGKIQVAFSVGDRTGKQVKKVVVRTDDPTSPVTTLTVKTNIPRWVELQPRLLKWDANEKWDAKTLDVTFHGKDPVLLKEAQAKDSPWLSMEIEEIDEGRHYRVTVQPQALSDASEAAHVDGGTSGGVGRSVVVLVTETADEEIDVAELKKRQDMLRFLVRVSPPAATPGNTENTNSGTKTAATAQSSVE
ncbi:MAG: DUF1573 domain-containing protein [Planctomycetota bacterium]